MRTLRTGTKAWLLSTALLFSYPLLAENAEAAQPDQSGNTGIKPTASFSPPLISTHTTLAPGARFSHAIHGTGWFLMQRSHGISCVPYARQVSGIKVVGNAWQWWGKAEGLYARGNQPEAGSVLNFRPNNRMRLGHVAVVTRVVNAREVIVDQANWPSGGIGGGRISHNVAVVDVSEANNWSAVRVELGHGGKFGSIYPTYGFIYNRPDNGVVIASVTTPAPQPSINQVPSDLRPAAERPWHTVEEVAEAPTGPSHQIDLSVTATPVRFGQ
jgi:CHAP domain